MNKQDLDLLLQARTTELQHEYENLVRSFDAASDTVKAIGRDIAENRSEARRLFDTRLKLARGDDLEAVLRLCKGDAVVAADKSPKCKKINGKKLKELPATVRLYVKQSDATTRQHANVELTQPRVVSVTSVANGDTIPRLSPITNVHSVSSVHQDEAILIINPHQQPPQQNQQQQQPQYSPVYVGDDHSYAVNEEETAEHQLMLEEELMLEVNEANHDHPDDKVDLTIVKDECLEENNNPPVDHSITLVKPVKVTESQTIASTSRKKATPKVRKPLVVNGDDETNRKRKLTRERMRRWRAKRKMEGYIAKASQKYKIVIAENPNA